MVEKLTKSNSYALEVVIMAAGKGTRMKSLLPKVLHRLAGRALLQHVLDSACAVSAHKVVVVCGHGASQVQAGVSLPPRYADSTDLCWAIQDPQLGTGHAVQQAVPSLSDDAVVLVLSGDVPLTQPGTLTALLNKCENKNLTLLTVKLPDPAGYGRIIREGDKVLAIVEHKDATINQLNISEIYSGIMAVPGFLLKKWLTRLDNNNSQREYYLTDIVKMAVADGETVLSHTISDPVEVAGVNSPVQLAELERTFQLQNSLDLMNQGVRLADPARLDVRGNLHCKSDVFIDVNCVFEGDVFLEEGVRIGANCVISNAHIGAAAVIHPFTHIEGGATSTGQEVKVGEGALIGPFARLRPGAQLGKLVHIGNFVEVKNSVIGDGAKANHLAYLGDAKVGERVNFGAGSITANYDGANKHQTDIGADVHIGSNCVLVAPIKIGGGGLVGAGSVVTKDTEPGALTVSRGKQISIANWTRPTKKIKNKK